MHSTISAGVYKSGGNRRSPFITVFLRNSYIGFSLTMVYQRSRNKGSGNGAAVLVIFPQPEGFKAMAVGNIIKNGFYRFVRPSKFVTPITYVRELL